MDEAWIIWRRLDWPTVSAKAGGVAVSALAATAIVACTPTVKVEAPKEPITINLIIEANVRVTLEEKAKEDIADNPDVF